tara:strand:- start:5237 stop:5572 length:336 start_codon:yes stop_codon:yes gene_type:complete
LSTRSAIGKLAVRCAGGVIQDRSGKGAPQLAKSKSGRPSGKPIAEKISKRGDRGGAFLRGFRGDSRLPLRKESGFDLLVGGRLRLPFSAGPGTQAQGEKGCVVIVAHRRLS